MAPPLAPEQLARRCDPRDLPFDATADAQDTVEILGQTRAIDAAKFAIGMRRDGYNLFALGPAGIGKTTLVRRFLERHATQQPPSADWCYVANLAAPHRPRALRLPPGTGARLRADMARALADLRVAIPAAFDSDEYRSRKHKLVHDAKQREETALGELQTHARDRRVAVLRTETGVLLAPLRGDEVLEPAAFAQLPETEQAEIKAALQDTGAELSALLRQFHDWGRQHLEAMTALGQDVAATAARRVFDPLRAAHAAVPAVIAHVADIERDIVANPDRFAARGDDGVQDAVRRALQRDDGDDGRLRRYEVNVMVDHAGVDGAAVILEDHPTYANLVGRIEHVAELGALVTDFTLIRPGALHRASGGYLLLDALKVLQQPFAWDALKRALRTHEIRIESLGQMTGLVPTVSLEPEPIPLEGVKVVLFGERLLYYLLTSADPEFGELFKVMVDFEETMDRPPDADAAYARLLAGLVRGQGLRPFDRGALARVIEHAARLAGDAHKLSIHLRPIVDLLAEADHGASTAEHAVVTADDVQAAIDGQRVRAGRLRDHALEAVRREVVLIDTTGEQIGQVNGLSVIALGDHAFGRPTRITARVRIGKGEVIDIEREVELGGPLHSKGVLILGGLLGARYAPHTPLSLSATIVFEQSYGGVEGDSASLAELCALVSAIAQVPLRQALAITGSVNQHGEVQPIGGVNEKIEGFFDVCRARGLTGAHGVVIPRSNVQHLMLRRDVVAAVAERQFQVHAVATVDEALALLTGRSAGVRDGAGRYPADSVNGLVEARLRAFADELRQFQARPPGEPAPG